MLNIFAWSWGDKYGPHYVDRLRSGIDRHLNEPCRFLVVRPEPEDEHLTKIKGCFARLRMFDPKWQLNNGVKEGDRLVCIDLDVVVTGKLDALFYRPETFMILQGANSANPCPFNGSIWLLRAGAHPEVWSEFSVERAKSVPFYEFPDDQGWMWHMLPGASGWKVGAQSGIFAFQKPGWPEGNDLPKDARLVVFPGWRDPQKFEHLDWVKEHWR